MSCAIKNAKINGRTVAPIDTDAFTKTEAELAFLGNDSVKAGYVPESSSEFAIPAEIAKIKASV